MSYKKHAYLIMAHNNFYILEKLLHLLDDPRNDIYVHIDKKVSEFDFVHYKNICEKATVIYPAKRIDVHWGTQSQVITELLLYREAFCNGPYQYYHLLSGVDLPLKTQPEIHQFFEGKQCEYLNFKSEPSAYDVMRVSRYHFSAHPGTIASKISACADLFQNILKTNRLKRKRIIVKKGPNWCDLTQIAVEMLLQNEKEILKLTKYSLCADEVYKQTFLFGCGLEICNDDLRLIDWSRSPNGNSPHTFTSDDWDMLIGSEKLFARKFSVDIDKDIVDRLYAHTINRQLIADK